jgi:hypothetical protein
MDFSIFPGWTGYVLWRLGIVGLWRRRVNPRYPRPAPRRPVAVAPAPSNLSVIASAADHS